MEERLTVAARVGNIDALYSLMKEDGYLLQRIEEVPLVDTPLHIAASAGQVHFSMEIMRLKPSFANKMNRNGYSPVHLALQNDQTQLVLRLLDADGDLARVQGREGKTPLHLAAEFGMVDFLDAFLSVCPESIQDLTIRKESALHVAVKSEQFEALKVLLGWLERVGKDGPVLKWCDDEGNTLLHVAASRNQIEVVNLLIARGVDVNAINMAGMTALDISQQPNNWRNPEIRDSLIHAGALEAASLPSTKCSLHYRRRDERLSDAAMKHAAEAGDVGVLYSLIREDPYILERFDDVQYVETPLHTAARLGHFNFAMEIMRWKPSFAKKPNQEGLFPVHLATINGHIQTLKQFLSFDTGLVRLQGREGKTSLHFVAEKGDILLLDTLLSAAPQSMSDMTDQNDTVLHLAIKHSKLDAFFFLLSFLRTAFHKGSAEQEKKVMNSQDEKGNTVLHIAVQMNQLQVVKQLIDSGVQLTVKNIEGLTALDASGVRQAQDNTEIRKLLLKAGKSSCLSVSSAANNWKSKITREEHLVTSFLRYKRDMSSETRNLLLIVVVLIATITYQTAMSPPRRDDDKNISCILSSPTNSSHANSTISCSMLNNGTTLNTSFIGEVSPEIFIFWITNIFALLSSILTIFVLLPSKYIVTLLYVPLYCFVFCYMVTTRISGSWLWLMITELLLGVSLLMLICVKIISRRVKNRRLIN